MHQALVDLAHDRITGRGVTIKLEGKVSDRTFDHLRPRLVECSLNSQVLVRVRKFRNCHVMRGRRK